jgi:O-antigen/teichoic acid export membrane protein
MTFGNKVKKHAVRYFIGSAYASALSFIMLKYYTSVFSPTQFGVLALYMIMFEYIKAMVSLNMEYGTTRLYFDYKKEKRDEYLSTIFWLLIGISVLVSFLAIILMPLIANKISSNTNGLYILTLSSAIVTVFVTFFTRILINESKSLSVMKQSVFQSTINHLSSFSFIYFFNLSLMGRIAGQGLGNIANLCLLLKNFRKNGLFKINIIFNWAMAKETFFLSLPLMFLYFQTVFFTYIDRIFLKYYFDNTVVGIYALGFILGQSISIVYGAISQAILPKAYESFKNDYNKNLKIFEGFSYKYYLGVIFLTFLVASFSKDIVGLVSNESYSESYKVMPFILAGFMMAGFYKVPSMILGYHKVVWVYPFISLFSFGIKLLLSWLLIPYFGMIGAAFSTYIGLFLYSFLLQLMSFKFLSKNYKYYIISIYSIISIVMFFVFKASMY